MSRTDQTRVCLPCLARMSRRRAACERCGGELLDLRDEAAQAVVEARLATVRPGSVGALAWLEDRRSWLYLGPLLGAVHPFGLLVAWLVGGPLAIWGDPGRRGGLIGVLRALGAFVAGGAMWIAGLLVLAVVGAIVNALVGITLVPLVGGWVRRARRRAGSVLALVSEPVEDAGEVSEARGRVRAIASVVAPLTGRPCVGWTIACAGPGGEVADAGAGRFEVVADDGVHEVVLGGGDLELGEGDRCELGRGSVALSGWSPGRIATPVIAVEAILADGDPVVVVGLRERRVFREQSGRPALRIRRLPGA